MKHLIRSGLVALALTSTAAAATDWGLNLYVPAPSWAIDADGISDSGSLSTLLNFTAAANDGIEQLVVARGGASSEPNG